MKGTGRDRQEGESLPEEKNSEQMFYSARRTMGNGTDGESCRFESSVGAAELRAAQEYLASYRHGARMLECIRYGREFMGARVLPTDPLDTLCSGEGAERSEDTDETLIRARMYGVRQFVSCLDCDPNARMLLYWHYIRGVSVSRVAEMMDISRASAFRIRKRALSSAALALRRCASVSSALRY